MPYLYQDTETRKNPIAGNPTLSVQGTFGTFDGSCSLDNSVFTLINFTPTQSQGTFDGSCNLDSSVFAPITQDPTP